MSDPLKPDYEALRKCIEPKLKRMIPESEAQAEVAAALGEAALVAINSSTAHLAERNILALISQPYQAALDRRVAEAVQEFISRDLVVPIHDAIARAWCVEPNTGKTVDVELGLAVFNNVLAALRGAARWSGAGGNAK